MLLNQFCHQHFQTSPSCDYEPCDTGYWAILKCGDYVEIAEGTSKKLARQNAAKLLCEKLGIDKRKLAIIDEASMKIQRIMGITPSYTQKSLGNDIIVTITAGNKTEEGIGQTRKEAKIQACEKLLYKLSQNQMIVSPILSNNITSFTKANEEGFSKLQLDEPEKGDKDISFEEVKSREKIGNHSIMKIKIANKKLLNYYQDQFLNYAKEKLNITPSNLPITDKPHNPLSDMIYEFDQKHLKPSDEDISHLESLFQTILSLLIPYISSISIERFFKTESFVRLSLRKNKFEMDVLAIYKPSLSNINLSKYNKDLCEILKDFFEAKNKSLEQTYNVCVSENKGTACLEITEADCLSSQKVFLIRIIPIEKTSLRLQMGLRINMEIMNYKSKGLKEDLAVEKRVLRMIRDYRWPEMKSEVLDLVLFNITRKFSEIDIIRNLRRFFEFIALGGFTCDKGDNEWFWDEFPTSFCDFIRNELKKEFVVRLEEEAKEIITKGGLESLFPKEVQNF